MSRSRSAPAGSSTTCRSRCAPAAASSSSAAAAPARASRCGTSSGWSGPTADACSSRATRSARSSGPDLSRVRKSIGFLFQNAALFDSISVGENVAFPMRRHTQAAGRRDPRSGAAEARRGRARAASTTRCPPRSRAACASAPAWRARWRSIRRILLVDEPSAGLDPITSEEIDALLLDLKTRGGTTLIVVTHNIPSARRLGDELVMLHEGRILAQGTPADLDRSDNEMVQRLHAVPALRLIWPIPDSPPSALSSSAECCCSPSACS